ncbi:hypothetical protein [Williamsia soli]|uniref:hypothetical protein n=1 Tax=Williamsia soli TaxID=364929 RepID=UPI001A9DE875|nr:hypothetical protein [Williamsia soli]
MTKPSGQPSPRHTHGSPSANSRTVLILAIIAIVLILLTGAVAAFIILDRSDDTADAAASSTTTVTETAGTTSVPAVQSPAPAPAVPASSNPSFQSADGEVVCEIGTQPAGTWGGSPDPPAVACLAFDYTGPGVQVAPCPSNLPTRQGGVAITPGGTVVRTLCTGGQPWRNYPSDDFPVLAAGQVNRVGSITCTGIDAATIACSDDTAGTGFTLSESNLDESARSAPAVPHTGVPEPAGGSEHTGIWQRKGAKVTLNPGGSGEFHLNSGAMNSVTYAITWTGSPSRVDMTITGRTASSGSMEYVMGPGDVVTGTVNSGEMTMTGLKTTSGPHSFAVCNAQTLDAGGCQR